MKHWEIDTVLFYGILIIFTIVLVCCICLTSCTPKSESYYNITQEERDMLAKLVYLEAGTCGSQCQRAVASVVFNLLEAGYWGDTLEEVIYYKNAFSPAYLIATCEQPPQEIYDTVDYILNNGPTIPEEVRYFRINYDFSWEGYAHYATYDNIYFGYFTNGNH